MQGVCMIIRSYALRNKTAMTKDRLSHIIGRFVRENYGKEYTYRTPDLPDHSAFRLTVPVFIAGREDSEKVGLEVIVGESNVIIKDA